MPGKKMTKKLKHETELLREALAMVLDDAVKRGVVKFDATDSHNLKIEYAYRLLVHDKKISPLPKGQVTLPKIKHRLAMWVTHQLPEDHALLN
jgi:predicted transcriptional regulator